MTWYSPSFLATAVETETKNMEKKLSKQSDINTLVEERSFTKIYNLFSEPKFKLQVSSYAIFDENFYHVDFEKQTFSINDSSIFWNSKQFFVTEDLNEVNTKTEFTETVENLQFSG